jgi:hypothetical protein
MSNLVHSISQYLDPTLSFFNLQVYVDIRATIYWRCMYNLDVCYQLFLRMLTCMFQKMDLN